MGTPGSERPTSTSSSVRWDITRVCPGWIGNGLCWAAPIMAWAVKPESPFKTFQDVLDAAKKKPLTMSHSGIGGIWHEGDGIMAKAAGVKFNYIPYKGGAPAVLAGHSR